MGGAKSKVEAPIDTPSDSAWNELEHPDLELTDSGVHNGYFSATIDEKVKAIPLEVMERIFTECSMDDILSVAQVCQLWKTVTVQPPFWKLVLGKYELNFESIPRRIRDHGNAWIALRSVTRNRFLGRNLIRNHSGGMGTFEHWDRDALPGLLEIESPLVACPSLPEDPEFGPGNSAYVCSYNYHSMSQRVDLWREGLTPPVMDIIGPFEIRFSLIVGTRSDSGGSGHFNAVFGEDSGPRRLLCEIEIEQSPAGPWKEYSFAVYFDRTNPRVIQKVRYLELAFGGKDDRFWQGHYGLKFARASMKVNLLDNSDLTNEHPHFPRVPITFKNDPLTL